MNQLLGLTALPAPPSWLQSSSDGRCWEWLWSEGQHCKEGKPGEGGEGWKQIREDQKNIFCHPLSHTWQFQPVAPWKVLRAWICGEISLFFGFKAVCDVLNAKARNPSYSELCSISGTRNSFKELTTSVELCHVPWPLAELSHLFFLANPSYIWGEREFSLLILEIKEWLNFLCWK